MDSLMAPRRCYCAEVAKEQQQPSTAGGRFRVMGTVVGLSAEPLTLNKSNSSSSSSSSHNPSNSNTITITNNNNQSNNPSNNHHISSTSTNHDYRHTLALDDGTGALAHVAASDQMVQAVQCGDTVDCVVVRPRRNRNPWRIESLVIAADGAQALTLRNLEILHLRQGRPGQTWGMPTQQAKLTGQDINHIIQAEPEVGVRLEDLHEMFVIDQTELQEIIQELQMQGLIYQSSNGAYLPL